MRTRVQSPTTHASTLEALAIAAGLLEDVAKMTQSAPYIQTLSSLITHIVRVNDVCVPVLVGISELVMLIEYAHRRSIC